MMKSGPRNCMSPQSCNKVSEKRWEIQRMKSIHQSILEDDDELSCGYWRWWGTVCDWLKLIIGVDDIWWVVSLRLVGIAEGSPESEFRQCLKQQTPISILGDSLKSHSHFDNIAQMFSLGLPEILSGLDNVENFSIIPSCSLIKNFLTEVPTSFKILNVKLSWVFRMECLRDEWHLFAIVQRSTPRHTPEIS